MDFESAAKHLNNNPVDRIPDSWELPIVTATVTDDRRRLVMPPELPAKSAVTIQQIDTDTWLVKRHKEDRKMVFIAIPIVDRLPDDPEWDKVEEAFGRHASSRLPVPEE